MVAEQQMNCGFESVELADALQAPQQVRQMAAVDAAIVVQLVDHDVAQVLEIACAHLVWCGRMPACSMSGLVSTTLARWRMALARILRRVAVVGEGADLAAHLLHRALKLVELILGQRLGGEQVHGARAGVAHQQIQHRQVVAERLAAGGRRDDDDVLAGLNLVEGLGLVRVEPRDPAFSRAARKSRVDQRRNIGEHSFGGRLMVDRADRRIRLQVLGAEVGHHRFERLLGGDGQLLGEIGESKGVVHCALSPFLCYLTTKAVVKQAAAKSEAQD